MGRVANPKLTSLWRDRVQRQPRSGLSIVEYCRREGFSACSFHAWKRRLRASRSITERKFKKRGRHQASHGQSPQSGFVQFPLAVESTIEIRFSGGTIVSVPAEKLAFTLKTLQALQLEGTADD